MKKIIKDEIDCCSTSPNSKDEFDGKYKAAVKTHIKKPNS